MAPQQGNNDYSADFKSQLKLGRKQVERNRRVRNLLNPTEIYSITTISFVVPWLLLWFTGKLSMGKMIVLLFCFDMILTIEAGINSNVLFIALLHVVTIPVFFALIYLDVVEEQKTRFSCFICGKAILPTETTETVKKLVNGRHRGVLVHAACIDLQNKDRKAFSSRQFKKGIPE